MTLPKSTPTEVVFNQLTLSTQVSFTFSTLAGLFPADPQNEQEHQRYFFCHTLPRALKTQNLTLPHAIKHACIWFEKHLQRPCTPQEVTLWFEQHMYPSPDYFPQFGYDPSGNLTLMPWHRMRSYFPKFHFEDPSNYVQQVLNFWTWKMQYGIGSRKWLMENLENLEPDSEIRSLVLDIIQEYHQEFKRYSFFSHSPEEAQQRQHTRLILPWSELVVTKEGMLPGRVLTSTVCEHPCLIQMDLLPQGDWCILHNTETWQTYRYQAHQLMCNDTPVSLGEIGKILTCISHYFIQLKGEVDFHDDVFVTPLDGAHAMHQDVSYWYAQGRFLSSIRT